jgi:hypothetical protein
VSYNAGYGVLCRTKARRLLYASTMKVSSTLTQGYDFKGCCPANCLALHLACHAVLAGDCMMYSTAVVIRALSNMQCKGGCRTASPRQASPSATAVLVECSS